MSNYRDYPFNLRRLDAYGDKIGSDYYRKLYVSENLLRAVIHSVLSVQVGSDWWNRVVDPGIFGTVNLVRKNSNLLSAQRSAEDIYFVYLSNLGKILFDNKGYFYHFFPQVERLVISIERVRLSRNLVGHMHVLDPNDKRSITHFHDLCLTMARKLRAAKAYEFLYP